MHDPFPDHRFEQLARLVGQALAKKWIQILNKKSPNHSSPAPPNRQRPKHRRLRRVNDDKGDRTSSP
jgi:hypothetical protein